jgi:hypothetical protein
MFAAEIKKPADWVLQIPPRRDFAPGFTALFSTIGALRAPCFLPPMAAKSKPPAVRVVVDSFYTTYPLLTS